jgi:hypothetical protein
MVRCVVCGGPGERLGPAGPMVHKDLGAMWEPFCHAFTIDPERERARRRRAREVVAERPVFIGRPDWER